LAEAGRPPFDFIEGESELVSGFNVEYREVPFSLIFLGEYLFILVRRFCIFVWLGGGGGSFYLFLVMFFLIFRCFYPRYRYDLMLEFYWIYFLG